MDDPNRTRAKTEVPDWLPPRPQYRAPGWAFCFELAAIDYPAALAIRPPPPPLHPARTLTRNPTAAQAGLLPCALLLRTRCYWVAHCFAGARSTCAQCRWIHLCCSVESWSSLLRSLRQRILRGCFGRRRRSVKGARDCTDRWHTPFQRAHRGPHWASGSDSGVFERAHAAH